MIRYCLLLTLLMVRCGGLCAQEQEVEKDSLSLKGELLKPNSLPVSPANSKKKELLFDPDYPNDLNFLYLTYSSPSGKVSYKPYLLSAAFISYGIMAHLNSPIRTLDKEMHEEISEYFKGHFMIEDFTQFVPALAVYGLELTGLKPRHSFRDRTFIILASHLFMGLTVESTKQLTGIERPNGRNFKSFPSGHTATAFTGAHILCREYKDVSRWAAAGGYIVAGFSGAMRMRNKKHWMSDVVAGAGYGILSVELSYLLLPVFQRLCGDYGESGNSLVIVPSISPGQYGTTVAYTFKL
ncbi:MAG: phosphatase PAP2 family protein [Tannerellaceae bacterium]|nr:phosphatase PAP2 family protein [Tannerellaceae bacterium]